MGNTPLFLKYKSLKNLNLSNNNLDSDIMFCLSKMLSVNNTLTDLDLSYNKINDFPSQSLFLGLKNNKSLKALDLSNNNLSLHNDVDRLSKILSTNKKNDIIILNFPYFCH